MGQDPVILPPPMIHERHRGIKSADMLHAWKSAIASAARLGGFSSWIAVSMDSKGRLLETVTIRQSGSIEGSSSERLIHHAMTVTLDNT